MAEAVLPDGSVIKVPDFALETTQTQMLAALKVVIKSNKDTEELYKKFLKEIEDGNKNRDKAEDKAQKTLEEIKKAGQDQQKSFRQQFADRVEGDVQGVFIGAGRAVSGLATAAVLATGAIIGFGAKIFGNLTDNLKDLTQAGLGFEDAMGNTASSAIIEFNKLGYTTTEAAQAMIKFASVTATIGRSGAPGSLTDTIKKFKTMTDNGLSLGMGFKEANEALLEELETRSDLGMLESSVTQRQLAGANQQIKIQTAYSAALGISADKLREMTKRQLENNTGMIVTSKTFGSGVMESAMAFSTAMNARGESLSKLADVFLDAGGQSSVFLSDAAKDLSAASPAVTDMLQQFAGNLRAAGNKLPEEAAKMGLDAAFNLQKQIGSLQEEDLVQLQRIVESRGTGSESAKMIILAYNDVKRTEKAMQAVSKLMGGIDPDKALKARIQFDNSVAQIKTTFDTIVNSLAVQFAPLMEKFAAQFDKIGKAFVDQVDKDGKVVKRGIGTALQESFSKISDIVLKMFGFDPSKMVDENGLRDSVVKKIDNITKSISDYFEQFMVYKKDKDGNLTNELEKFDWSAMFKDIGKSIAAGILNGIGDFLWALPGMIIDGAKSLFTDPPEGAKKEVGASIAEGVAKIIGFLLGVGVAKSAGALLWNMLKSKLLGDSAETLAKQRSGGLGGVADKVRSFFGRKPPSAPGGPGGGPSGPAAPGGGPAGPGRMDKIANGMKSLGSGIASLGVGIGRMLASIGKGGAMAIVSVFKGLATGLSSLAKMSVLKGIGVMTLLAAPVFLVGEAFKSWKDIEWPMVLTGIGAIAGMGVVAAVAGSFAAPIALGALALGALGLALQLFPIDTLQTFGDILNTVVNTVMVGMPPIITAVGDALAKLVEVGAKGFDVIMNSVGTLLERLSGLDAVNLAASAVAIAAISASLALFGGTTLIAGLGKFFGTIFGGGDPFERLIRLSDSAPALDKLSSSLGTLASVLGTTGDMIDRLAVQPLEDIVTQFTRLWENLAAVELNVLPYQEFAAISTANLLGNAAAINQIAAANRAQNQAYAEFIKLDEAKFRANVQNAFNYNRANKGETEESTGLLDTISNMFRSLRSSPATPVVPQATSPTGSPTGSPSGTSATGSPTAMPEKNQYGKTQLEVLTEMLYVLEKSRDYLNNIKDNID